MTNNKIELKTALCLKWKILFDNEHNNIFRTLFNLLIKEYTSYETYSLQEVFENAGNDIKTTVSNRY